MFKHLSVYVAHEIPQEGRPIPSEATIETLKTGLREISTVFATGPSTPDSYELLVRQCVQDADLMLAVFDELTPNLAWQIGVRVEKHDKPVLVLIHKSARLGQGFLAASPSQCQVFRYNSLRTDGFECISQTLKQVDLARRSQERRRAHERANPQLFAGLEHTQASKLVAAS